MKKEVFIIGTIAYSILAILALVFYCERTAFLDIAFHLFYIIKDSDFAIQNNRFSAVVTEIYPLLASKIGLELKTVMQIYSLAFVLNHYIVFAICVKLFKAYQLGIVMLLFSTLMVTDTFYWIASELPQGIALLILFFGFLWHIKEVQEKTKWWVYVLILLSSVALVFFHPLMLFPFVFFSVFLFFHASKKRSLLVLSLITFLGVYVGKSKLLKSKYDATSMEGTDNITELFPNYIFLESNENLLSYIVSDYYILFLFFIALLIYYVRNSSYLKMLLLASFVLGYALLVNVTYPNGGEQFYMENLYLPLSIFVAIPLAFDMTKFFSKRVYLVSLIILLGIRIAHIGINHQAYTDRVNYLQEYLAETETLKQKKLVVHQEDFPMDTLLMTWATPYEFWLLSTIDQGETRSVFITDNFEEIVWTRNLNEKFITKWGAYPYKDLPPKYFNFKDTSLYDYNR